MSFPVFRAHVIVGKSYEDSFAFRWAFGRGEDRHVNSLHVPDSSNVLEEFAFKFLFALSVVLVCSVGGLLAWNLYLLVWRAQTAVEHKRGTLHPSHSPLFEFNVRRRLRVAFGRTPILFVLMPRVVTNPLEEFGPPF